MTFEIVLLQDNTSSLDDQHQIKHYIRAKFYAFEAINLKFGSRRQLEGQLQEWHSLLPVVGFLFSDSTTQSL
jgi:hypothetical protein